MSGIAALCELDRFATSLSTLERVVLPLIAALECFEREGFATFAARFASRDLLRGRAVRGSGGCDGALEGVATGVSATGELLVRTAAGIVTVSSGEVSIRLVDAEASAPNHEATRSTC